MSINIVIKMYEYHQFEALEKSIFMAEKPLEQVVIILKLHCNCKQVGERVKFLYQPVSEKTCS